MCAVLTPRAVKLSQVHLSYTFTLRGIVNIEQYSFSYYVSKNHHLILLCC